MKLKLKNIGEKYYIHSVVISIILFLFHFLGINNSFLYTSILNYSHIQSDTFDGAVYPIEYVPNPLLLSRDERNALYKDIDSKYFIPIPKYDPKVFGKDPNNLVPGTQEYNNALISRIVYTVPYMGSYTLDYKEYSGSHPAVDIIAPVGTPIRSIANGVVVKTGFDAGGFGNHIVIRHDRVPMVSGETKTIYSSYSHLNTIGITTGSKVKKGDFIGTVGNTGMSTTPHLHFQIDLDGAPFVPFWPFTGAEARAAGLSFFGGVNAGLGRAEAILYTINPFEFINKNESYNFITDNNSTKDENQTIEQEITIEEPDVPLLVANPAEESKQEQEIQETKTQQPKQEIKEDVVIEEQKQEIIKETIKKEDVLVKEVDIIGMESELILLDNTQLAMLSGVEDLILQTQTKILTQASFEKEELEFLFEKLEEEQEEQSQKQQEIINTNEQKITNIITQNKEILFKDISKDYKYYEELKFFKDNSIITGFSDNTFRPKNNITRTESLKIILLSLGYEPIENKSSIFRDINSNSWENTFINAGVELGVIDTKNTYFYPFRNISRAEGLKIILELSQVRLDNLEKDLNFVDVSLDSWYYDYVNYAYKNNLLDNDGIRFYPNKPLSREEIMTLLYRYIR